MNHILKLVVGMVIVNLSVSCNAHLSVRLKNNSDFNFKKIIVQLGDTTRTSENLKSKQKTASFKANYAYPFSFTSIVLQTGDTITHWPVDHVGEKKYKRGKIIMIYDLTRPFPKTRQFRLHVKGCRKLF